MPKVGEDNWYLEKHKNYLKHAHTSQKEKEYASYKIKEKIIKTVEEVFSPDILSTLFPKSMEITNEFISEFKKAIIENESQQMYEFLKFSKSYYLREEIHPYAITHEIIYQSLHGHYKEDAADYDFRYKNGDKIDIDIIKEASKENYDWVAQKKEIAELEEDFYSENIPEVKQAITNRITQNIKSENIIRPYQTYLIDEETDCIYKNYCKLFMEIYRPFSEQRVQEWINPTSILKKDKDNLCIPALIQDYNQITENVDIEILKEKLQNDTLPQMISKMEEYQEQLINALKSIFKLYNNVIYVGFPNTFDKKILWEDSVDLEQYLLEKIFGLGCITYLCNLNLSDEKTLAIAMLLNPISITGFNSLHRFIIGILRDSISEEMANLIINITLNAQPVNLKYYSGALAETVLEFLHFIINLQKLNNKIHRMIVGDFIKYLKYKRTYDARQSYFQKLDDKLSIEIEKENTWYDLDKIIESDRKYLLCGLLYNKINHSSNRRIVDDEGVHIVDRKKRYGRSDDIEGCMNLLYGFTIDPFLLYTDDTDNDI